MIRCAAVNVSAKTQIRQSLYVLYGLHHIDIYQSHAMWRHFTCSLLLSRWEVVGAVVELQAMSSMQSELRHLWHRWIFLNWPGDLSSCACGDQNQMFLTGRRAIISSHLCSDKTTCFWGELRTSPAISVETKNMCFTGRRFISSHTCGKRCIYGDLGTSPAAFVEFNRGIETRPGFPQLIFVPNPQSRTRKLSRS